MAQQPSHYSMYMLNHFSWNPAYAGLDNSLSITGVYRSQWVGLEGSPVTQNINAHLPLYVASSGIGINLENDQLGAQRLTSINLSYNFQRELGAGILSLGARAGIVQRSLDGSKILTPDGEYGEPGVPPLHNDDLLPTEEVNGSVTTFGVGLYYQSEKLESGLSISNITEPSADLGKLKLKMTRNYFFTLGMHFDLNSSVSIHPSILVRSDLIQTQTDFSTIVRYNDNIFFGASFRGYNSNSIDALVLLAGLKLSENITLAYAYDLTLSGLRTVNSGSHEVMLNYNLNKIFGAGRPPKIIYNPRSL
ncbi:MAG: membrane protein [Saprospiraceae bacterium]|nr:MAG: membrane protein [Saprospiraceae bacterium]